MIKLHRTVDIPPLAILICSDTAIFPWSELLALRDLVTQVEPTMAHDEDAGRIEGEPWAASGSSFGIALMHAGLDTLFFEADDWEELRRLLYAGQELLSQVEVAEIVERPQPRIAEAIATGALFAFQVPELERRQWLVPRGAIREWIGEATMEIIYGFHGLDLFNGCDDEESYDIPASAQKYADLVQQKLEAEFPDAEVIVRYDLDATGELPFDLQAQVDGWTDDDQVLIIDQVAADVYEEYRWVVRDFD